MVAGQIGAAHLEAVAVACRDGDSNIAEAQVAVVVTGDGRELERLLLDRLCSQHQITVLVGGAVLDGDRADGTGCSLCEEIPAVIGVVSSDAAVEDVALAGGQFGGKAVGVFHRAVCVVHGGAVLDGVVAGPQSLVISGQAGDLQAGVAVVVEIHLLEDAVAAGQLHTLRAVCGVGDVDLADVPVIAPDTETSADAAEVQRCVLAVSSRHGDGSFCGAVAAALDFQLTGQMVGAAFQLDGLACCGVVQRGLNVNCVFRTGAIVSCAAVRGDDDDAVRAQSTERNLLLDSSGIVAAQLFVRADSVVFVRGELDLKGGIAGHGVALGEGLTCLDVHIFVHDHTVCGDGRFAVGVGLEHQFIAVTGAGGRAGDLVNGGNIAGRLERPLGSVPRARGVGDVGEGHVHAARRRKAQISFVGFLHGHGVVQLCVLGDAGSGAVLRRDVQGRRADDVAGRAVGVDGVLGGDVAVAGLGKAHTVGVALLDGLRAERRTIRLDVVGSSRLVGDDAGVAADAHSVFDLNTVQRELGADDRNLIREIAAGAADAVAHHEGKSLLTVRSRVHIIDGDIGLQIEVLGGRVDGGVVEGQAVCRGVRDELAALLVDGAIIFDGAGVEGDLAVDVRAICDGVDSCCSGGAEGFELPVARCGGRPLRKRGQRCHAQKHRACQQSGYGAPDALLCVSHRNSPFPAALPESAISPLRLRHNVVF